MTLMPLVVEPAQAPMKHTAYEEHLRRLGPQLVVGGGEAGGGQQRDHLERAVSQRVDRNRRCRCRQSIQVTTPQKKSTKPTYQRSSVLILRTFHSPSSGVVEEHEGDAAEEHEDDDDPVEVGAVVVADAGVVGRVAGGRDRAEGVAQRVEERHAAQAHQDDLQQVERQVDHPQVDDGVAVAGGEPLLGDDLARARLGAEDAQAADAVGQEDDGQGQKAHAAEQVGLRCARRAGRGARPRCR